MAIAKQKSKKSVSRPVKSDQMRSFRRYPNEEPFFVIRISQQTFYWLIISALILALGIWTVLLSTKVQTIYDQLHLALAAMI